MQEKLRLSKSEGASTHAEFRSMQNVPYASAVGSIIYAVRCTRPDVAFAQNITSRFQQNLGDLHWTTIKNILKYLRNTKDMFLSQTWICVRFKWRCVIEECQQSIYATSLQKCVLLLPMMLLRMSLGYRNAFEWLGRVVHCITGVHDVVFNVSNPLCDSGSICIDRFCLSVWREYL
ncbi:hypothetical protein Tco_0798647 [Tanacetum coccineum]